MSFNKPCFLTEPEWRPLMERFPDSPESISSQSYIVRSKLCGHLADIFNIILDYRSLVNHRPSINEPGLLARSSIDLLNRVKKWRHEEIVPILSLSTAPTHLNSFSSIRYPDILSGVIDSVTSSMLACLYRILRSFCFTELKSLISLEEQQEIISHLGDSTETEIWQRIADNAYNCVKGMSIMASKTLELGMQQFHVVADSNVPPT
jgi:hypothetical protein